MFDGLKLDGIENVLDMGTGTGIIAIYLQLLISQNPNFNPRIFASDILEESIDCAKKNEVLNKINNKIIYYHSDLFKSFPESSKSMFNIIIFNPPYLPSSPLIEESRNTKGIDYSWDGGIKGVEIVIDFLKEAKEFLNLERDHYIYCITSSRSNIDQFERRLIDLGYKNKKLKKAHKFFEDIILNRLHYIIS
ncbi:MAG: methyltransferase [Promethearchaeota archaeon]